MNPVTVKHGAGPVVLGLPHTGTWLPTEVFAQLTPLGRQLTDTDWHVERLYDGLLPAATTVRAEYHRYLIDANRDPTGASLYPGQNTTALVPLTDFDEQPLWRKPPDAAAIEARRQAWHAPYHAALRAELERVYRLHGVAVLYDCHSIRSRAPFLFDGILPDFSIGTNDGTSCDARLEQAVVSLCNQAEGYGSVLNGRFRGGWTTRHYGQPAHGMHAIQMELTQRCYLASEAPPFDYDPTSAERLRNYLRQILQALEQLAPTLKKDS